VRLKRTPSTWTASIATVLVVFVAGQVVGAWLYDLSGRHSVVAAFWVVVAVILSALWGPRLAVLFILPSAAAFVTNELVSTSPVSAGFYAAATQVAPVLLLALGLEEWSLRHQARTHFEKVLFIVLLSYIVLAVGAGLYGSGVCDATAGSCRDLLLEWHVLGGTYVILTAANVAAAGIAGGLVAIAGLAALTDPGPTPSPSPSPDTVRTEPTAVEPSRPPSVAETVLLWCLLRRR
jgi:hypothetical protein